MISPPSVARNILANFAGRGWAALINLVFVPLYIRFLGVEAYGLIGVYYSLMAILSVLDMGLSSTLGRELARLSAAPGNERESRDLVRTMESVYWCAGALIGLFILALAPLVAFHWVRPHGIRRETVEAAVMIMGGVIAFEWPAALYAGGLMGLQRQGPLNAIRAAAGTVQAVGAAFILWRVSPSILAYFSWQLIVSLVQTLLLGRRLYRSLPESGGPSRFRRSLLEKNWRFAAGMTGISLMSTLLTQADKVVLSRLLPLETFGYYVLAFNVASALQYLVQPVIAGLYPRLCQAAFLNEEGEVAALYHKGCQLLSVLLIPTALTIAFFSGDILGFWLGNEAVVSRTRHLLSLLTIGTMMNGIMAPPFALQIAYGWTRLSFYKNIAAAVLLVPVLLALITRLGEYGAAAYWILLNAGYLLIEIPLMHRRLLPKEKAAWWKTDVGLPALVSGAVVLLSGLAFPEAPALLRVPLILLTALLGGALSAVWLPGPREWWKRGLAGL